MSEYVSGELKYNSKAVGHGAFLGHFNSAIKEYQRRRPLYAKVSQGESEALFKKILFKQKIARPLAWLLDCFAKKYQNAGIPLLELDFVDMKDAPEFLEQWPKPWPKVAQFYEAKLKLIKAQLNIAAESGDFKEVSKICQKEIHALSVESRLNAFYRHFIESLARMSFLAPQYISLAESKGLSSPKWIIVIAMKMHIMFLGDAINIDRQALPMQLRGIPILTRDVPSIPERPV